MLSNADGPAAARAASGSTDLLLLSGDTGLRKPDPAAFADAVARLGVAPGECVHVDDLPANVRGAVAAGLVGVLHRTRRADGRRARGPARRPAPALTACFDGGAAREPPRREVSPWSTG